MPHDYYGYVHRYGLTPSELRGPVPGGELDIIEQIVEDEERLEREVSMRNKSSRKEPVGAYAVDPVTGLNRRVEDPGRSRDRGPQFRHAFIAAPGYNFNSLKPHLSGRMYYLTDGFQEDPEEVWNVMREVLEEYSYDPDLDLIVPVSSVTWCFQLGQLLGEGDSIAFAHYDKKDRKYDFYRIEKGTTLSIL